jgi:hypothetical protein
MKILSAISSILIINLFSAKAAGDCDAHINYLHFHEEVRVKYGVDIFGWPETIQLRNPSTLSSRIPTLTRLRDDLKNKRIYFRKLTTEELEEAKEKHRRGVEAGTAVDFIRKRQKDAGQKKSSKKSSDLIRPLSDDEDIAPPRKRPKKSAAVIVETDSLDEPNPSGETVIMETDRRDDANSDALGDHNDSEMPEVTSGHFASSLSLSPCQPLGDITASALNTERRTLSPLQPSSGITPSEVVQVLATQPEKQVDDSENQAPQSETRRPRCRRRNSLGTPPPIITGTRPRKRPNVSHLGYSAEEAIALLGGK